MSEFGRLLHEVPEGPTFNTRRTDVHVYPDRIVVALSADPEGEDTFARLHYDADGALTLAKALRKARRMQRLGAVRRRLKLPPRA